MKKKKKPWAFPTTKDIQAVEEQTPFHCPDKVTCPEFYTGQHQYKSQRNLEH